MVFRDRVALIAPIGFLKVLPPRSITTTTTTRRALTGYFRRQENLNGLRSWDFGIPYLSPLNPANNFSSVFQHARGLHQSTYNLSSHKLWEKRLDEYQTIKKRCWRKASDLYKLENHQLESGEDAETLQDEMSKLERGFDEMTWRLLHNLRLVSTQGDSEAGGGTQAVCSPTLLPPVIVGNVFYALSGTEDIYPLRVFLPALVGILGKRYGSYEIVQKLANFPLLQGSHEYQDTTDVFAAYRVLTAYLFYTALTPSDIPGILLDDSVLGIGKEPMARLMGGEAALIKEYFCFLQLYLEMCETNDDLCGIEASQAHSRYSIIQERIFNRQSRRILSGRLDKWIKLYQAAEKYNSVFNSEGGCVGTSVARVGGLTEEQKRIVKLDLEVGDLLKIKAFAGTGKTKVLIEYAKARPEQRFLFLTFNNSVQKDAEKKFGPNVDCSTIHSLARQVVFKMQPQLSALKIGSSDFTMEIKESLALDKETIKAALDEQLFGGKKAKKFPSAISVARVVNESLLSFFSSIETEIDYNSLYWMMADKLGLKKDVVLEWTRTFWDKMINGRINRLPHDGYLKMFHLYGARGNRRQRRCKADTLAFGKYDVIMLDEAQDADKVMAEIISRQRPFVRTIVAGDPHQMIYEFRGANNECFDDDLYPPTYKASLTHSFRFGPGIAGAASPLLRALGESNPISAIGEADGLRIDFPEAMEMSTPAPTVIKALPPALMQGDRSGEHIRIFRTNKSLILHLFSYCRSHPNHKVHFQAPKHMQSDTIWPLLKAAHGLVNGCPAKFGPLKGIKSIEMLKGKVFSTILNKSYPEKVYKALFKAATKECELDKKTKILVEKAMRQAGISRGLRDQIENTLKSNPRLHLKSLLQALLSKGFKQKLYSKELNLIIQLEKRGFFSTPDFLEMVDLCKERMVEADNSGAVDITLSTAHQAKGLEWSNVAMADEFNTPYVHRYDGSTMDSLHEEIRGNYVTATRARKEFHVAQKLAVLIASEQGSYRFLLSPIKGECPMCRNGSHQQDQNSSEGTGFNPAKTRGLLIGYEAILPTGRFGSTFIREMTGKWPFGDREDVIGCHKCVVEFYRSSLCGKVHDKAVGSEVFLELERFVKGVEEAMNGGLAVVHNINAFSCEPVGKRKGWLEAFEEVCVKEKKMVVAWTRSHMILSWGVSYAY